MTGQCKKRIDMPYRMHLNELFALSLEKTNALKSNSL
jgi:hypothetical protein